MSLLWSENGENGTPGMGSRTKIMSMQDMRGKRELLALESGGDTWDTRGEANRCEMPQGEWLLKIPAVVVMKVSLFPFEGYCR